MGQGEGPDQYQEQEGCSGASALGTVEGILVCFYFAVSVTA